MFLFCWLFLHLTIAAPPSSKNRNIHVIGKYSLASDELEFLLDVSEVKNQPSTNPQDYSLTFNDGIALGNPFFVESISQEQKTTVLLFDDSISMWKAQKTMTAAAKVFLSSLDATQQQNHTVDILTGSMTLNVIGEDLDINQALTTIDILPRPQGKNTALRDMIDKAIDKATEGNDIADGGLRQVIVFSDGLEESSLATSDVQSLIDKAHVEGVQIHFLFSTVWSTKNNSNRELKNSEVTKLDRLESLAKSTGGVNAKEDLSNITGNLTRGAKKIASKVGNVIRVRTTLCEVQKSDSAAVANISYGTMDYAFASHNLHKTAKNSADCTCPTTCQSNEVCKHGECVVANTPQSKGQGANSSNSTGQNNQGTNTNKQGQGTNSSNSTGQNNQGTNTNKQGPNGTDWTEYWWIPLLVGALLGLLLWRKNKRNVSKPKTGDGEEDSIPETIVPPIKPVSRRPVRDYSLTATWSTIGHIHIGFPSRNNKPQQSFTFMHQFMNIGNPNRASHITDEKPTHVVTQSNIQRIHLDLEMLEDGSKRIRVEHPGHAGTIWIEEKAHNGRPENARKLVHPTVIDPRKDLICLDASTYHRDSNQDGRIYLIFDREVNDGSGTTFGTMYSTPPSTRSRDSNAEQKEKPSQTRKGSGRRRRRPKPTKLD